MREERREREEYEERRLREESEKESVCREEREKVSGAQEGCAGEMSREEKENRCREEDVVPNKPAVWWKTSWLLRFR